MTERSSRSIRSKNERAPSVPPPTTMLGALSRYLRETEAKRFQPMNSNWGLVDPLPTTIRDKKAKREALAARAQSDFEAWMASEGIEAPVTQDAGS